MRGVKAVLASPAAVDHDILHWLVAHRTPAMTAVANTLMRLGLSMAFLGLVLLAALTLTLALRAFRPAAAGGGAALLTVAASLVLKQLIARPRPDAHLALVRAAGYSMPSTDAALIAAITAAVVVAVRWSGPMARRVAAATVIAANVMTGLVLVYLVVHWTTDVLAGWLLGGTVGALIGMLARPRFARGNRHERRPPGRDCELTSPA